MKASSSKSQETDASPLSEQKQPLTELRFRFRASALKQSPSSDALLHDGEEEEDFLFFFNAAAVVLRLRSMWSRSFWTHN